MTDEREFLSRWSKRKAESRQAALEEEGAEEPEGTPVDGEAGTEPEGDPDDHPAADIDIDALDRNSDYSVFLNSKVPAEIRHRALQKLWLSDPIYANLDGLAEYDLDYTDKTLVVKGLKVAFDEARRRMLDNEARERAEAEARVAQQDEAAQVEPSDETPGSDAEDPDADDRHAREDSDDGALDA